MGSKLNNDTVLSTIIVKIYHIGSSKKIFVMNMSIVFDNELEDLFLLLNII